MDYAAKCFVAAFGIYSLLTLAEIWAIDYIVHFDGSQTTRDILFFVDLLFAPAIAVSSFDTAVNFKPE
jgi:hypothetical protein